MKEKNQIFGKTITSIKEEIVELARALHSSKERLTTRKFIVEGEEQILWAMHSLCHLACAFIHDKLQSHPLAKKLKEQKIPYYFVSDGIIKKITETSYLIPFVGIVEEAKISQLQDDFIVVLDGIQDFGNIGTIIRTWSRGTDYSNSPLIRSRRALLMQRAQDTYRSPNLDG